VTTVRSHLHELGFPPARRAVPGEVFLPPPFGGGADLLMIAGEHSGDEHAARLIRSLGVSSPGLRIAALGGPEMADAGAQLLHDLTASSVVGLVEVLKNYSFFRRLFDATLAWITEHQPRAVLFVDYPGFNLRLAAALRERGISVKGGGRVRTLFYISPQIWAWKAKRRFTMARDLDALAVIFPFEVKCYADTSLPVAFVGHPFLEPDHRASVSYGKNGPILLLPGSRRQAVSRIFPVLLAGYRAYRKRPAVVVHPSELIADIVRSTPLPQEISLVEAGSPVAASAVLTSSGTMSLQCALAGIPGAIAYRANPLTYVMGKMLLQVKYLGIANLLLGEPMYPEYIQGAARSDVLARELMSACEDPQRRADTQEQAAALRKILTHPAGITAPGWVLKHLG